jgi:hypothetical protein
MNLVERLFCDLTEDAIRDESSASVAELIAAINAYLAVTTETSLPKVHLESRGR